MEDRIFTGEYWAGRIQHARDMNRDSLSVLLSSDGAAWERMQVQYREVLARYVGPETSVLDVGCGYGRLLDLMPQNWRGRYLGVDISEDFLDWAVQRHPSRQFLRWDAREPPPFQHLQFDLAVCAMLRGMVVQRVGYETWALMRRNILQVADRILILETGGEESPDE